jgi:hypothetical protein
MSCVATRIWTSRPRSLPEKTRRWHAIHGYPTGPVHVAPETTKAARCSPLR